ncbi:hypothetical protein [Streptomyces doebereineriae]|uniref:Uncharacterized protein n=1 Tax=Streptomyces doebereineriae TaxID=3075528 RepID=A0ABU2VK28_9ACTN|nr:hypothetical protein [Streptomyces sp. DSM 41640]MDT0485940.1 hypothetical protein [Streptomyces sp. DSM 41640]
MTPADRAQDAAVAVPLRVVLGTRDTITPLASSAEHFNDVPVPRPVTWMSWNSPRTTSNSSSSTATRSGAWWRSGSTGTSQPARKVRDRLVVVIDGAASGADRTTHLWCERNGLGEGALAEAFTGSRHPFR